METPALAVGISITVIMISAFIFDRLRMPHILGVLVAGILIGQYSPLAEMSFAGFEFKSMIITDISLVETFATIGAALIMFGIGLEFSAIRMWKIGSVTFFAALFQITAIYMISQFIFSALGFSPYASVLISVALSFTSTPIVVKLLEETGKIKRPEANHIISVVVIEDLLVVFFIGLAANGADLQGEALAVSIIRVLTTFAFAYFVLSRIIDRFLSLFSHSEELIILSTVSMILMIGYLASAIGLSFSVGAFLAGSIIAGSPHSRSIEEKIRPFNSLFASFFFFSIGLMVNLKGVFEGLPLLFLFMMIGIFVKSAVSGVAAYLAGFSGRNASFCAVAFISLSELSLLLVSHGASSGLVPSDLIGVFAFAIIATSFVSALLINRENEIYHFVQGAVPLMVIKNLRLIRSTVLGVRRAVSESSRYYKVVERLPSISQNTEQFSMREQLSLTAKNSIVLFTASALFYFAIFLSGFEHFGAISSFFVYFFALFFVSSAFFLVNLKSAQVLFLKMFLKTAKGSKYAIAGHFAAAALFLLLCLAYIWAFFITPNSFAIILALPCIAFAARSLISGLKALSAAGRGLG